MKWRKSMITAPGLLAGMGVIVGAWGYFGVTPAAVQAPGGFEVWQVLRPGEDWQTFWSYREGLRYYGGAIFLLTAAMALLHYAMVGPDRVTVSGRKVQRFRGSEVLMHMALALSFLVLWVSGLYLLWSRLVLEGPDRPRWWSSL